MVNAIHMKWGALTALQDCTSCLDRTHFLIRLQCLHNPLNILVVPLQEEVGTVLAHPMVIWISESATWSPEITVPHGICHLVCCYIPGYLQGRKARNDRLVERSGIKA